MCLCIGMIVFRWCVHVGGCSCDSMCIGVWKNEYYMLLMFILLCPMLQKEHLEREIEKLSVRTNSLGKDRNHNRYWFFRRERRLFVESSDSMQWGYYSTKEEVIILWTCVIMLHPFFGLQLRC